ncbi:hypothetical protein LMH73_010295 [Vibrio splendidus]|nr:hypothetical protein [Vibrio splendidus]MCC4882743.1 hypothetical protein [Vibrio splendidus]
MTTKKQRQKQKKKDAEKKLTAQMDNYSAIFVITLIIIVFFLCCLTKENELDSIVDTDVRQENVLSTKFTFEEEIEGRTLSKRSVLTVFTNGGYYRGDRYSEFKIPTDKKVYLIKDKWMCDSPSPKDGNCFMLIK